MKKIFAIVACAAVLSACGGKMKTGSDVPVLDINAIAGVPETPEFKWNDIAESVEVVQLHNADKSPVGMIFVHQMMPDGGFVMRDLQTVGYLADKDGEIYFSLNRQGRGAGEYLYMANIRRNGDLIYVQDGSQNKMLIYRTDGSFVRDIVFDGNYMAINVLPDGNIMAFRDPADAMGREVDYITVFSPEGDKVAGYMPVELNLDNVSFTPGNGFTNPEIVEYEDGFLVMPVNIDNDTTYFVNSRVCEPRFVCSRGNKAGSYEMQLADYDEDKLSNMLICNLYGSYGDYVSAYITDAATSYGYYLLKDGKPVAVVKGNAEKRVKGFMCELPNGKSVELNGDITRDGKLVCRFYGYQLEGIVDGMTEESDPVLVVVTLKK